MYDPTIVLLLLEESGSQQKFMAVAYTQSILIAGGRGSLSNIKPFSPKILTDDFTFNWHRRWKIFAGSVSFSLSDDSSWWCLKVVRLAILRQAVHLPTGSSTTLFLLVALLLPLLYIITRRALLLYYFWQWFFPTITVCRHAEIE